MWWRSNESVDSRITVTAGRYRDFFFSDSRMRISPFCRSIDPFYIYIYISILPVGFPPSVILERAATSDRFVNARFDAISRNGCFPRKNILRVLITVHDSRMDRVEFAPNSRAMIKPSSLKATTDRKGGRKTVVSRLECYEKSLSLISFNERCLNQVSILNISFLNPEFSALTLGSRKDDISSSLKNKRKKHLRRPSVRNKI